MNEKKVNEVAEIVEKLTEVYAEFANKYGAGTLFATPPTEEEIEKEIKEEPKAENQRRT